MLFVFQIFKKSYGFIKDIQKKEKNKLYAELKKTTDAERIKEIKFLIQRIVRKSNKYVVYLLICVSVYIILC